MTALAIIHPEQGLRPAAPTLREMYVSFVKLKGTLAPSTLTNLHYVGKRLCDYMDGKDLNPINIAGFIQSLIDGGTIGSAKLNGIAMIVRGFLKFLHRMDVTQKDLSITVPKINHADNRAPEVFTEAEYEQIKDYCHDKPWCQPHLWLIILAYRTGMSLVDCCHLRWCNVHLYENGPSFIDIRRIKIKRLGDKALCTIPIIAGTDVHDWLMRMMSSRHLNYKRADGVQDYVHQDCPGLYACAFQRIGQDFNNIFKRAGIKKGKTFRHFRNTFCSNLVNSGAQVALICKMTGHNNVAMLLRYLKPDRRSLQEGLNQAFQFASTNNPT